VVDDGTGKSRSMPRRVIRGFGRDLNNLHSIAKNIKQGTLEGFDEGQGVAIGATCRSTVTARRRQRHIVSPKGAVTPMARRAHQTLQVAAVFEIGMTEYEGASCSCRLRKRRLI